MSAIQWIYFFNMVSFIPVIMKFKLYSCLVSIVMGFMNLTYFAMFKFGYISEEQWFYSGLIAYVFFCASLQPGLITYRAYFIASYFILCGSESIINMLYFLILKERFTYKKAIGIFFVVLTILAPILEFINQSYRKRLYCFK